MFVEREKLSHANHNPTGQLDAATNDSKSILVSRTILIVG